MDIYFCPVTAPLVGTEVSFRQSVGSPSLSPVVLWGVGTQGALSSVSLSVWYQRTRDHCGIHSLNRSLSVVESKWEVKRVWTLRQKRGKHRKGMDWLPRNLVYWKFLCGVGRRGQSKGEKGCPWGSEDSFTKEGRNGVDRRQEDGKRTRTVRETKR